MISLKSASPLKAESQEIENLSSKYQKIPYLKKNFTWLKVNLKNSIEHLLKSKFKIIYNNKKKWFEIAQSVAL